MAQVAADMLGLPIDNISVKLGNSTLPQCPVEGGSWIAASVCNAIANTARAVREDLLELAKAHEGLAAGRRRAWTTLRWSDGKLVSKRDASRAVSIAERDAARQCRAHRAGGRPTVSRKTSRTRATRTRPSSPRSRWTKSLASSASPASSTRSRPAASSTPRPPTARSWAAWSWGIGMALHEETLFDHRFGRVMNANIAEYHVPVNADVHDIEVIFVDEPDETINPLGIKGLGEIGIVGVAAAIANAVYHATGKRVRDLPITLDKVIQFD